MTGPAVAVEGLAKRYRIGSSRPAYRTLRDALSEWLRRAAEPSESRTIWALRDLSFEIEPGEPVGVIGANGAGKTTLLKILSRITEPTAGRALVRGRVGSLLEVGTGFHPELTGRENIYLNGAILGMRRAEIAAKLDEIVSFAEIERFVDTPVKRYSSGMYVRLAFAVAAHLETDILLVDEVLSVGDFRFQQRCLSKMHEQTAQEGRTVVFVSHNLGAIKSLTDRCLWLDRGRLRELGPTEDVFRNYVLSHHEARSRGFADLSDLSVGRPPKALAHDLTFDSVELLESGARNTDTYLEGDPIVVRVRLRAQVPLRQRRLELICRVHTLEGVLVFTSSSGRREIELEPGLYETSLEIDPNPLGSGSYALELYMLTLSDFDGDRGQDLVRPAIAFHIEENPPNDDDLRYSRRRDLGLIRVAYEWDPPTPAAEARAREETSRR